MSIVVRFSPIALTTNKYDEAIRQIKIAGEWPPAGLDYHVCFGSDGNLKVSCTGSELTVPSSSFAAQAPLGG